MGIFSYVTEDMQDDDGQPPALLNVDAVYLEAQHGDSEEEYDALFQEAKTEVEETGKIEDVPLLDDSKKEDDTSDTPTDENADTNTEGEPSPSEPDPVTPPEQEPETGDPTQTEE